MQIQYQYDGCLARSRSPGGIVQRHVLERSLPPQHAPSHEAHHLECVAAAVAGAGPLRLGLLKARVLERLLVDDERAEHRQPRALAEQVADGAEAAVGGGKNSF